MIKVTSVTFEDMNSVIADVFADTKSEVSPSATIVGLPEGKTLSAGSTIITASGELAFVKSDGTFNWL